MGAIVEQRIDVLYPDGKMAPVTIRIGAPRPDPRGDYACSVAAEGLRIWEGPVDLFGAGPLHALTIALRFLRRMLAAEAGRGAVFRWEGGEEPLDLDGLFSMHEPA